MSSLADILFRTVDGVYTVNAKQRITYWNNACEQLFDIPAKDALGHLCSEIVQGKDRAGQLYCKGGYCASLAKGGAGPRSFPLRTHDRLGNELQLSVNIILVPSHRRDRWICVHLLHRGSATDVLQTLKHYSSHHPRAGSRQSAHTSKENGVSVLTARECEVLGLLAEGLRATTIAQLLQVSPVTVRNHIQHIISKLGVHSQLEAVTYAYRHNLV